MRVSTIVLSALTAMSTVFCPVKSAPAPVPAIRLEGRDFNSRFAPAARPVFPRSYYEITTPTTPEEPNLVARGMEDDKHPPHPPHPPHPTSTGKSHRDVARDLNDQNKHPPHPPHPPHPTGSGSPHYRA